MLALYQHRKSYETHLRNLESWVRGNPTEAGGRLVLAYHYMTGSRTLYARQQLKEVIRLKPEDRVAADLLEIISGDPEEPETEVAGAEEAVPDLPEGFIPVGTWKAKPAEGGEIVLVLTAEKKFTWNMVRPGTSADFAGSYLFQKSRLMLEDSDEGGLIVRITPDGKDGFVLKPEGKEEGPGLRFEREK